MAIAIAQAGYDKEKDGTIYKRVKKES